MNGYNGSPPPIDQRWAGHHPAGNLPLNAAPAVGQLPQAGTVYGYPGYPVAEAPAPESTLQEAHRLTHGPRRADYGHPLDDYTRTAGMVSALLAHKLKEPLLAEEVTMIMQCVKLSRHVNAPKRDNMVDEAGYAWATWEIKEERDRRGVK